MAGHAPEIQSPGERIQRWIMGLSDARISLYMLLATMLVGVLMFLVDRKLLG